LIFSTDVVEYNVSLVSQVEALLHIYVAKNNANIILAAFKTIVFYRCNS